VTADELKALRERVRKAADVEHQIQDVDDAIALIEGAKAANCRHIVIGQNLAWLLSDDTHRAATELVLSALRAKREALAAGLAAL
jgi:hypothetical protein